MVRYVNKEGNIVVGNTLSLLMANETITRCKESNTGDLVVDTMRFWVQTDHPDLHELPVLGIMNAGSLRWTKDISAGSNLTKGDILNLLPFGNMIVVIETSGSVLKAALEHSVANLPNSYGGFLQVGGFTFIHNCHIISAGNGICYSEPGSRILNVSYTDGNPILDNDMFYLAMPDYLYKGGDGYAMLVNQPIIIDEEDSIPVFDSLLMYIQQNYFISPQVDGRIMETQRESMDIWR